MTPLDASTHARHSECMEKRSHARLRLLPPLPHEHDEVVQRALELLREQLAAPWTVTSLARRLGLSRPVFARRFRANMDQSPMRCLTAMRMDEAARLLRTTDQSLAQVAEHVGYSSEFAFNRAFKRHHRCAPGLFRRHSRFEFRAAA
jgi:AraC-like DNA-binding protein